MAQATEERGGTRAVLRHSRTSAFKVRPVLDLIRGEEVQRAREILQFSERDAAQLVGKLLASAVANAENNDGLDAEELYVSACYADEGTTMRRWRPRARGRATRIRKRSCHVTVVVSRLPEERLSVVRKRQAADAGTRARRVAGARKGRRPQRKEQREAVQPEEASRPEPPEQPERPEQQDAGGDEDSRATDTERVEARSEDGGDE